MLGMSVQSLKGKAARERYEDLTQLIKKTQHHLYKCTVRLTTETSSQATLFFSDQVCHDVALATEDAVRGREGEVCARQVSLSAKIQTHTSLQYFSP